MPAILYVILAVIAVVLAAYKAENHDECEKSTQYSF